MTSKHYMMDREARENLIKEIGYGETIKTVMVDRGHKNGPEIHEISNTGIVTIYNARTKKMITKLIARPGQIRRYYKENEIIPAELLKIAKKHQEARYNLAQKRAEKLFFFSGFIVKKLTILRPLVVRLLKN